MRLLDRFMRTRWGLGAAGLAAVLLMATNEMSYQYARQRLSHDMVLADARMETAETLQTLPDAQSAVPAAFTAVPANAAPVQKNARISLFDTLMLSRLTVHVLAFLALAALYLQMRQLRAADALRLDESARLAAQVHQRTVELRELASHLETAREDERGRLARDLHDELGGLFTAMKLDFARLRRQAGISEAVQATLLSIEARLNEGIVFKRRVIEKLRPSALDQLGLATSIILLCRDAQDNMGMPVRVTLPFELQGSIGGVRALAPEAELTVYRLVQESLTNIAKYAAASAVEVLLRVQDGQLHVDVHDNGSGFDPLNIGQGHHGLSGMRYRVESQGGRLRVDSSPGQGTLIHAHLPMRAPAHQAGPTAETIDQDLLHSGTYPSKCMQDFSAIATK